MLQQTFSQLFEKEINTLYNEISLYESEEAIWRTSGQISNSAGNLCLHLIGNLNHFIGTVMGNTGYIRVRDLEFSDKNVPKAKLLADVEATREMVKNTFAKMQTLELEQDFPLTLGDKQYTNAYMLMHLLTHLGYHTGQINYHKRLLGAR